MNLNEHTAKVVKRARAFYAKKEPGHFLVSVSAPVERPEIPPLNEFDLDRQLNEWLDWKLKRNRPYFRFKEGIDDDSLPVVCPHFGIAEHSAWLGMDVHLQKDTCLPVPLIKKPGDIEKLTLSENTKWFRYMKEGYDYLRSRKDGTACSVYSEITPNAPTDTRPTSRMSGFCDAEHSTISPCPFTRVIATT